jgi:peptidoglycan/LPS O-acetylase OafA/YrhL
MVGGWILLLFLLIHNNASYVWVAPWIILALYIAAFHGVIVNRFVTNPWITTIGGMCYTIYLLHNYIIAGLGSITERFGSSGMFSVRLLIQFVLMTPIVLAICGLYFRFVERPCMRPDWPPQLKSAFLRIKLRRGLAWMAW